MKRTINNKEKLHYKTLIKNINGPVFHPLNYLFFQVFSRKKMKKIKIKLWNRVIAS